MSERIVDGRTDLVFDLDPAEAASSEAVQGAPLIAWCAYHGDVSAIRHLLASGVPLADLGVNFGLGAAAFHGHWQLCQFLIESGAQADHADPATGETPLHGALCKANRPNYDRVVEILLAAGADPNQVTKAGAETSAFMRDCRTKGETALHRAAAFGSERVIQLLLEHGADVQARDMGGDSPLTWASWHLRPPAILRLLAYGDFRIHPNNTSTYDHGVGWSPIDLQVLGKPHT